MNGPSSQIRVLHITKNRELPSLPKLLAWLSVILLYNSDSCKNKETKYLGCSCHYRLPADQLKLNPTGHNELRLTETECLAALLTFTYFTPPITNPASPLEKFKVFSEQPPPHPPYQWLLFKLMNWQNTCLLFRFLFFIPKGEKDDWLEPRFAFNLHSSDTPTLGASKSFKLHSCTFFFAHSTNTSVQILPQRGSSHSRACRLACHSPLHRFPQPKRNHNQNSRSVSDASSDLLLEYIHCWILAMRKI